MTQKNPTISILVPCFNEEKTIRECIHSWLNQSVKADEIIIVNDCSADGTAKILDEFKDRVTVINLPKNTGNKSFVQEEGLKRIKTDVFVSTDADTIMDKKFVERVQAAFRNPKVQAFAGYIKSLKGNWLTACREIDYLIGQDLHKVAQHNINYLFVIPGCAGAFRTDVFQKYISIDHDTLTEDLDFTYKIHKSDLRIFYDRHAIVYTQDPENLHSYVNQMRRWYSGGWQNLRKHFNIIGKPTRALEISMVYAEGLVFYPLMFLTPILSIRAFMFLLMHGILLSVAFGLYSSIRRKRLDLFLYSPLYLFVTYVHAYVFIEQFIKEIILKKKNMIWFHPERRVI